MFTFPGKTNWKEILRKPWQQGKVQFGTFISESAELLAPLVRKVVFSQVQVCLFFIYLFVSSIFSTWPNVCGHLPIKRQFLLEESSPKPWTFLWTFRSRLFFYCHFNRTQLKRNNISPGPWCTRKQHRAADRQNSIKCSECKHCRLWTIQTRKSASIKDSGKKDSWHKGTVQSQPVLVTDKVWEVWACVLRKQYVKINK